MLRGLLTALAAIFLIACAQTSSSNAAAQTEVAAPQSQALLNHLVGHWRLTGAIAGQHTTHDVDAAWVLQDHYVRINEVSRERAASGLPQYEATIFIGWLDDHYVCTWLDNTGVASGKITCTANAATVDALPFEFRDEHGALQINTTFRYNRADDSWTWTIDNIDNGRSSRFADLVMRRR